MQQKVDPAQIEGLAAGLRKLGGTIENEVMKEMSGVLEVISGARHDYTREGYVQSAADRAEELAQEIRTLTKQLERAMEAKAKDLINVAEQYRKTEKLAGLKLKQNKLTYNLSYNPKVYSNNVKALQKRLNELGYNIEVDGKFGKETKSAVSAYKKKYGLGDKGKDEGVVGEQTWLYLFGTLVGTLKYDPHTFNEQVRIAQTRLKELGYDVEVTGYFDKKTKAAVSSFKKKNQLGDKGDVEGVIGPNTWDKLFSGVAVAKDIVSTPVSAPSSGSKDLVSQAQKVIFGNEGDYGTVTPDDGGGLSIGKIQWHGSRARDLINQILKKKGIVPSDSNYKEELKKWLPASFYNDLINYAKQDKWWNSRKLSTQEKQAIKTLITSIEGKQVQDDQAWADVQRYLNRGKKLGIKDTDALIYFADLENQSPQGAERIVQNIIYSGKSLTLKNLHQVALKDKVMGDYVSRREATFKHCSELTIPPKKKEVTQKSSSPVPSKEEPINTSSPPGIEKFLAVAEAELAKGFKEHVIKRKNGKREGDNITPYGEWYKLNGQPWCAMFVSYCANKAGILDSTVPKYALVVAGSKWYKDKKRYKSRESGYSPKAGDVIFFRKGDQNHTGIVTGYDPDTKTVYTIEGNTKDRVARRSYQLKDHYIVGYGLNGGSSQGSKASDATSGKGHSTR